MSTLSASLVAFADAARRYCAFVERATALSRDQRLRDARALVAELVAAACRLSGPFVDGPDRPAMAARADWPGFGDLDWYNDVDPYRGDGITTNQLSDDLLDIYHDLREGLALYDAGHPGAAGWQWRFHFEARWGAHAVDALRVLHRACRRVADD